MAILKFGICLFKCSGFSPEWDWIFVWNIASSWSPANFHIFIFSYSKFRKICSRNGGILSRRNNNLYFQIINIVWPSVLDPVMYSRRKKEIKTGCHVIQFKVYTIVSISRIYSSASIDFWNLLIIFFIWLNSLFSNLISW